MRSSGFQEQLVDLEPMNSLHIVFEQVMSEVDAEVKSCPRGDSETRAPFPETFSDPMQHASDIKSNAVNPLIAQMSSIHREPQCLQTLIGPAPFDATKVNYVLQLPLVGERSEQMAIEYLLRREAMHVDEISIRVENLDHWIHACSAGDIARKFVHNKHGLQAVTASGITPQ